MYLDTDQIEHLEELAERLAELKDELDDLSDKFKDLSTDDEFDTEDLRYIVHLLGVDALNAVSEADDLMSDYLFRIEDEAETEEEED